MHFLGIFWDGKNNKPQIKYREKRYDPNVRLIDIHQGEGIIFSIQDKRYCIGSTSGGGEFNHLCKTAIIGEEIANAQCDLCRQQDSLYFTHLNGLNVNQLNELKNKKSINYINVFGNKLLKTGVTGVERKVTRVLEQGAFATIFFTLTDAYSSRIIENLVSSALSIRQAYSWNIKLKYLYEKLDNIEAKNLLDSTLKDIKETLSYEYGKSLLAKPEYIYNYDKYFLKLPVDLDKIFFIEHLSYGDVISGKIIGIYGQIILLQQQDESIIGLNAKSMQGFLIDSSNNIISSKLAVQPKLIELYKNEPENLTLF